MTENPGEPDRPLNFSDPSLSGPDVAAAVGDAESGSEAEGSCRPAAFMRWTRHIRRREQPQCVVPPPIPYTAAVCCAFGVQEPGVAEV